MSTLPQQDEKYPLEELKDNNNIPSTSMTAVQETTKQNKKMAKMLSKMSNRMGLATVDKDLSPYDEFVQLLFVSTNNKTKRTLDPKDLLHYLTLIVCDYCGTNQMISIPSRIYHWKPNTYVYSDKIGDICGILPVLRVNHYKSISKTSLSHVGNEEEKEKEKEKEKKKSVLNKKKGRENKSTIVPVGIDLDKEIQFDFMIWGLKEPQHPCFLSNTFKWKSIQWLWKRLPSNIPYSYTQFKQRGIIIDCKYNPDGIYSIYANNNRENRATRHFNTINPTFTSIELSPMIKMLKFDNGSRSRL